MTKPAPMGKAQEGWLKSSSVDSVQKMSTLALSLVCHSWKLLPVETVPTENRNPLSRSDEQNNQDALFNSIQYIPRASPPESTVSLNPGFLCLCVHVLLFSSPPTAPVRSLEP